MCGAYNLEGFVAIRSSWRERSVFWPHTVYLLCSICFLFEMCNHHNRERVLRGAVLATGGAPLWLQRRNKSVSICRAIVTFSLSYTCGRFPRNPWRGSTKSDNFACTCWSAGCLHRIEVWFPVARGIPSSHCRRRWRTVFGV